MTENKKPEMTMGQKRLLWLVYIMGGFLIVMFIFVLSAIAYQFAHLH